MVNGRSMKRRKERIDRGIKKALYFSPNNAEYHIVFGDACFEYSIGMQYDDNYEWQRYRTLARKAYRSALYEIKDDEVLKASIYERLNKLE